MPVILLSVLLNRYTIGALVVLGLIAGAYLKGYSAATAKCHDAELRAEIATMKRDMAAWKAADAVEKILQDQIDQDRAELQKKVTEYEAELAKRPDNRCSLDDSDVRNLNGLRYGGKR